MNGNGSPVNGSTPVSPPRLINPCQAIHRVTPRASNPPNVSGARLAVMNPKITQVVSMRMSSITPTNPKASPTTAKALSECGSGTCPLRVYPIAPGPFPNSPPERMASHTAPRWEPAPPVPCRICR